MYTQAVKVNLKYILVTVFAVIATWLLHELAHWSAGIFLGYDMAMTLNTAYPLSGTYLSKTHTIIINGAGPLFTLAEAVVVFILMKRNRVPLLYPFLFSSFYIRFLATLISFLNPNDEARISLLLGLGKFTLPIAMSVILFLLLYKTSDSYSFSRKLNLITLVVIIIISSIIILSDQFFRIRLI